MSFTSSAYNLNGVTAAQSAITPQCTAKDWKLRGVRLQKDLLISYIPTAQVDCVAHLL
jgi:hypothetical protein